VFGEAQIASSTVIREEVRFYTKKLRARCYFSFDSGTKIRSTVKMELGFEKVR
jgi:hypothetical protein